MKFVAGLMTVRIAAGAGLVWLRLHPADWSPLAFYGLRGLCWAVLAASLARRFVILRNTAAMRPANTSWWRALVLR